MTKGKLIVLDGIDGSGKATQSKLLSEHLVRDGVRVKTIDFPRYYDNFFGKMLGEYLSGAYGDFIEVDPRLASVLFAADRFESSGTIRGWLDKGFTVITDRYATANQIHQGGKIDNLKKRREFMSWLAKMEYGVFGIPKPDLVVYLDVPFEVSSAWLKKKVTQRKKKYLKGRKDVAEDNLLHLKNSRLSALQLAKENKNWSKVECCPKNICLPIEKIHDKVYSLVKSKLKI